MSTRWTTEEDNLLSEIYPNSRKADILPRFNKDWTAICRRARKLKLHRDKKLIDLDRATRTKKRKDSISDEEIALLKEIFENNTKEYILNAFKRFNRSSQSIFRFAKQLGLKRNPDIILQEMKEGGRNAPCEDIWTDEEDAILRTVYSTESKGNIEKALPGRTWSAIRSEAVKLKLRRNPDKLNEERTASQKKTMMERHGVEYSTQLESMKQKSRQTNIEKRGVPYPTQDPEVREKVKVTVQTKYGTDNVFQSEEIKKKIKTTNLEKHGVENPNQSPEIRAKTIETNKKKYGVENPFQMKDRVKKGMMDKYGQDSPLKVPEIKAKVEQTNLDRYGYKTPAKNERVKAKLKLTLNTPEVREKKQKTMKERDSHHESKEENTFYLYLKKFDPTAIHHKMHPILKHDIDFYLPKFDLWVQYDGAYYHNKPKTVKRDKLQNAAISNLLRFSSDIVNKKIKDNTLEDHIKDEITKKMEFLEKMPIYYQYKKKTEWYDIETKDLPFNPDGLITAQFTFNKEDISIELTDFIEKYEKLKVIKTPQWCFTARFQNRLTAVVLINDPKKYSELLGNETPKYEALIQVVSSTSWVPEDLESNLIIYSCTWVMNNTNKRLFIAYIKNNLAGKDIIYQTCGFDFIGNSSINELRYALVISKNKKEKDALNKLKTYTPLPYIKDENLDDPTTMTKKNQTGKTRDRKNDLKIEFILDNHREISNKEIAKQLNESLRWVKRQIQNLTIEGRIERKNPKRENLLTIDKWPEDVKNRAIKLRVKFLKGNKDITTILKKEFNFDIGPKALGFWYKRFNCPYPTKTEWLQKHLPYDKMKELLDQKMRRIDIKAFIKDKYQVNINDDLIGSYINSIGL